MLDELYKSIGTRDIFSLGECIVQAVGSHTVAIINMLGLELLERETIIIKASKNFNIKICGENLTCKMLNKNEITIYGRLSAICWEKVL